MKKQPVIIKPEKPVNPKPRYRKDWKPEPNKKPPVPMKVPPQPPQK